MKLGQHFLIDEKKIKKFVDALDLKFGETIIEIGPGHGELTAGIKHQVSSIKIIAIEKDEKFVRLLRKKFALDKNIEIIEGDALKILPELCFKFQVSSFKITGNIPFYITGYLFRVLGELKNKPSLILFFIQKEVAQRICAKPPKMNLLAASIQFWAEPEIIDYISKKDFQPAPEVNSAIIKFNIRRFDLPKLSSILRRSNLQEIKDKYYRLIKALFKQPRKTILNNLTMTMTMTKEDITKKLKKSGINPQDRPQNLDIKQIKELSTLF